MYIYLFNHVFYIYILSFFDFMRSFFKANKPTSHGSNALKLGQTNKNRPIWIFRQWHRDRGVPGGAPGYPDLIHRLGEVHFDIPRVPFSKSFNSDHRRRPLKVDFPNKYPLCRVYMGLIIKGTVPKGITIFPIFFWWVFLESHWWPKNKISLTLPETNICFLLGWPIFKGELLVLGSVPLWPLSGVIQWDIFWVESNEAANVASHFEGFPCQKIVHEIWVGKFPPWN